MFTSGDRLFHTESGKRCSFQGYEVEGWTGPEDCAWVVFDRIWFKKKVEKLVWIKNLKTLAECSPKYYISKSPVRRCPE